MPENGSYTNCCEGEGEGEGEGGGPAVHPGLSGLGGTLPSGTPRPPWVAPSLAAVLIVTTAVDVVGNLLVILSVLTNRKLRNAGEAPLAAGDPPVPQQGLALPGDRCLFSPRFPCPFLSSLTYRLTLILHSEVG